MNDFPTMLYRCPGQHAGPCGKTYESQGANDQDEYDQLAADGYHPTMMDAVNPPEAEKVAVEVPLMTKEPVAAFVPLDFKPIDEPISEDPPTREELNNMGKELNLKFDGRTSDKNLSDMINGALNVVD